MELIKYEKVNTSSDQLVHMVDKSGNYFSLDDVLKLNAGKVIYIDIWASWCGPCKAMMPASKTLQEQFKEKEVVFVYLSIDQQSAAWEKGSSQFNLVESNYLVKNYPKASFFQTHNVSSIPRYFLYDRKGDIVDSYAPRPNSTQLAQLINKTLEKPIDN